MAKVLVLYYSSYGHIETPHLHGYMHSQEGEIRLVPLSGGRTRLGEKLTDQVGCA